jgi:hypothetical protein
LVAGLVYRRLIQRDGLRSALARLLRRAVSLYLLTVGLTLLFVPFSEALALPWAQGIDLSNPLAFVVSVLTLHRTYYLVDVMLLYTVLFFLAPLALVALAGGRVWLLLGGVWLLGGLHQVFPEYVELPWPIASNYLFQFSAWQGLFFTGMALGYHRDRMPALQKRQLQWLLVLCGLMVTALVALYAIVDLGWLDLPALLGGSVSRDTLVLWFAEFLFAKGDLRPGRLIASAAVFGGAYLALTLWWSRIKGSLGRLLFPLGQNSLYAYTVHIVVVGVIGGVIVALGWSPTDMPFTSMSVQLGSILVVWVLTSQQILAPTPATRPFWQASPAVIAVVVLAGLAWMHFPAVTAVSAGSQLTAETLEQRRAKALGTPVARSAPGRAPTPAPTLAPDASFAPRINVLASGDVHSNPYVGQIQGTLYESYFYSSALDADMPYYIYLPPDYGSAGRRYPVLYLLHGTYGEPEEWLTYGLIDAADQQISTGDVPPMLIVMPRGGTGYWTNHAGTGPRWGDYVARDLMRHIDSSYRTLRERSARAIGGLSMGGWGALHLGFSYPSRFGVIGARGPSLRYDGSLDYLGTGDEFDSKDPLALARNLP